MGAVLILADSRSPEMRHEVPVVIPDAFLYLESNGRRVAVVSAFEVPRIEAANAGIETLPPEKLGMDELLAGGMPARARGPGGLRARLRGARDHRRVGARRVSARAGRPSARQRRRGHRRARAVRGSPAEQDRDGDRRPAPRPARVRGGARRRARAASRRRRRAGDLRADQAGDRARLQRARRHRRRVHRLARRAGRDRPRARLGPDRAGRGGRDRPVPARPRDRHVLRHDPHLRRRRGPGRAPRVPPALQGGAGAVDGGGAARRERPRPDAAGLRPLRRRTAIRRR